jgi:hypothetical protein
MHVTGHEGGQGGGASPGDLKLSGVMLGAKEKEGGDRVENQELGAEPLHKHLCEKLLTLEPHRYSLITQDIRTLISVYLQTELHTFHLRSIGPTWPGKPKKEELRSLDPELKAVASQPLPLSLLTPKQAMWQKIHQNYHPNPHPSYIACTPPLNPTPPPAIQAATATHNRLASVTIFRWATGHSFNARYSIRFHPGANDIITCPCANIPTQTPPTHTAPHISTPRNMFCSTA